MRSKADEALEWLRQRDKGLRSQGRAATEEESRAVLPNRELRPQYEKEMYPDISEVKKKAERDRGR